MLQSGSKSYYDDYVRKKGSSRIIHDPPSLLTDRGAYVNFLEVQLERVSAACLGVQSYDQRFNDMQSLIVHVEERVAGTTKLLALAQQCSEEFQAESTKKIEAMTSTVHGEHKDMLTALQAMSDRISTAEKSISALYGLFPRLETIENRLLDQENSLRAQALRHETELQAINKRMEEHERRLNESHQFSNSLDTRLSKATFEIEENERKSATVLAASEVRWQASLDKQYAETETRLNGIALKLQCEVDRIDKDNNNREAAWKVALKRQRELVSDDIEVSRALNGKELEQAEKRMHDFVYNEVQRVSSRQDEAVRDVRALHQELSSGIKTLQLETVNQVQSLSFEMYAVNEKIEAANQALAALAGDFEGQVQMLVEECAANKSMIGEAVDKAKTELEAATRAKLSEYDNVQRAREREAEAEALKQKNVEWQRTRELIRQSCDSASDLMMRGSREIGRHRDIAHSYHRGNDYNRRGEYEERKGGSDDDEDASSVEENVRRSESPNRHWQHETKQRAQTRNRKGGQLRGDDDFSDSDSNGRNHNESSEGSSDDARLRRGQRSGSSGRGLSSVDRRVAKGGRSRRQSHNSNRTSDNSVINNNKNNKSHSNKKRQHSNHNSGNRHRDNKEMAAEEAGDNEEEVEEEEEEEVRLIKDPMTEVFTKFLDVYEKDQRQIRERLDLRGLQQGAQSANNEQQGAGMSKVASSSQAVSDATADSLTIEHSATQSQSESSNPQSAAVHFAPTVSNTEPEVSHRLIRAVSTAQQKIAMVDKRLKSALSDVQRRERFLSSSSSSSPYVTARAGNTAPQMWMPPTHFYHGDYDYTAGMNHPIREPPPLPINMAEAAFFSHLQTSLDDSSVISSHSVGGASSSTSTTTMSQSLPRRQRDDYFSHQQRRHKSGGKSDHLKGAAAKPH